MSLRKGLAIFLFLTLGVSTFIISRSVDKHALEAFMNMDKISIVYALLFVFAAWSCDASRFCLTARAMGYKIRFVRGLVLTWLHYFGCALTPMQVGGGPFQVYVLYKSGVPVGSGIAITLIRTLFSTFLLSFAAPAAFMLVPQLREGGVLVKGVFYYVGFLSLVMWVIFILSIVKAKVIKKFCGAVLLWLKKFKCFSRLNVHRIYHVICSEVDSYSENVKRMVGPGLPYF
ncbi:MAG: flippase-like domain-containing protein, partial [Pyramidobacter sp.]|nr:flippase-like domain-containing protein [Pyramidobacter sp.]